MRRKILIYLLVVSSYIYGQDNSVYQGGLNQLYRFVADNINLTLEDKNAGIDGIVIVKFRVDGKSIDSINVINKVTDRIDNEVIRVMHETNGKWMSDKACTYLMEIKCTIDNNYRLDLETVKSKLKRVTKKSDIEKMELYMDEIRRRTPYDTNNLKQLAELYKGQNRISEEAQIHNLISDIRFFSERGLIIGR